MTHAELVEQIRARRSFMKTITGRHPAMRKRMPKQLQPDRQRQFYWTSIKANILAKMHDIVQNNVLSRLPFFVSQGHMERGDRHDGVGKDVRDQIKDTAKAFADLIPDRKLENLAGEVFNRTEKFQADQLAKQIKATVGIDLFAREPNLLPLAEQFTAENVALIKSVSSQYFSRIETTILRGVADGDTVESIAQELQDAYNVSESRAKLIARDQVGKLQGDLNEARQTALGIAKYTWETMNDERVRDEHAELQGKEFEWSNPPEIGNPGEPINCRCYAAPVLDDIIGDL